MAGKYLATSVKTSCPTRVLAFSVDTTAGESPDPTSLIPRLFHSVHWFYSYYRRGKWSEPDAGVLNRPADFWRMVYRQCRAGGLLNLLSPCLIDDLTLLGVWAEMDAGRIRYQSTPEIRVEGTDGATGFSRRFRGRLLTGNPPDVLYAMTGTGPVRALSLRNYTTAPLGDLATAHGVNLSNGPVDRISSLIRGYRARDAAQVTLAAVRGLADWWRAGDCGPWRDTAPQLALSLFKRHYLEHKMLIHENPDAAEVELAAMHGPRQSVWFYGDVGAPPRAVRKVQPPPDPSSYPRAPGPLWRVDVRSQYPYLMTEHDFPSVLMGVYLSTSVGHLHNLSKLWGLIATVRIRSDRAELPVRTPRRTTYPVGSFVTTLAGPELLDALDRGEVLDVGRVARYQLAPLFRTFGRFLWDTRRRFRDLGDVAGETWTKLIANSFTGKLAQKPGRWVSRPDTLPRRRWGVTIVTGLPDAVPVMERGIANAREVWDQSVAGRAVARAAFAYMTSYSRLQMLNLRRVAGAENVYAQHTDCLWVNGTGFDNLNKGGFVKPEQLGGLKPSGPLTYTRFLSPAHRYCDGVWTAGGIAEGFAVHRHCLFRSTITANPHRRTMPGKRGRVSQLTMTKDLSTIDPGSPIGPDGWAFPPYESLFVGPTLPDERPDYGPFPPTHS